MRQVLVLMLGLLLSFSASLPRQSRIRPQAKLVHRYERQCGYSCAQELAIDLGGVYGKSPSDTVAVRFCSKEPLPLALFISAADYAYVSTILQGSYGYTPERVLFLRSEDCIGSDKAVAATEFWVIPTGAALPTSVESIRSSQARIDPLGMDGLIGSARTYKTALQKLPTKLRANPEAVGVVVGYYYKQPSLVMKRRLREMQKMLERSGLSRERYFVRLAPSTGEYGDNDPEPKYPSVFVVEVAKGKDSARR
ncbi:MAG: hypothetical protein M3R69_00780 [Acidobacteriota bacterium]|nr:hypothetical protein [Acidobacteriota bacterium]